MADGQPQSQQPRTRMAPYRETFWIMAMSLLTPIGIALIILISFKTLTMKGALLAGDVAGVHAPIELQCEKCHNAWNGPTDAKCQACHQPELVRDHARGWTLPPDHPAPKDVDCKGCHIDHHGRTADLRAQASTDCILCHGFKSVGESSDGHPEVRMVSEKLVGMMPQSFRQFKHADHVGRRVDRDNPNSVRLDCKSCHQFKSGDRVLVSTEVKFDKDCKSCHSDQLSWTPDRRTPAISVTHPNIPALQNLPDFTPHDQFLNWASQEKCGECHNMIEKRDATNAAVTVGMEVGPTRIQSDGTWLKLRHWGYGEFSHAQHLDPALSGASHPLHCTDCHESNDRYATFISPSFDRHCIQCHATQTAIHRGPSLKHPALPVYGAPKDDDEAKSQLTEQLEWIGHDPNTGAPVPVDNAGARQCSLCHKIEERPGLIDKMKALKILTELRSGVRYAGLEPLLAQATDSPSPDAGSPSASSSDSASPTAETASASASTSAATSESTPAPAAAATDSATAATSSTPAAESPSALISSSESPSAVSASSTTAAPSPAAVASPSPHRVKPEALVEIPEDKANPVGDFFNLYSINKVEGPVSEASHFIHRPHITIGMQCEACHHLDTTKTVTAGPGLFDMQLLPSIEVCAKCHNSSADGVTNRCGSCHDFHDKTRRSLLPVELSPQSHVVGAPHLAANTLLQRLSLTWKGLVR